MYFQVLANCFDERLIGFTVIELDLIWSTSRTRLWTIPADLKFSSCTKDSPFEAEQRHLAKSRHRSIESETLDKRGGSPYPIVLHIHDIGLERDEVSLIQGTEFV